MVTLFYMMPSLLMMLMGACMQTRTSPSLQPSFNQHLCKTMVECSGLLPFFSIYLMKGTQR